MACMTLMRNAGRLTLSKTLGGQRLVNFAPTCTSLVQKKSLTVSPVSHGRIYGPSIGGESHSSHWKTERYVSIALLPLIPAAIIYPNAALDYALSATLVLHTYWGLHGAATDYIHGPVLPKIVNSTILLASILAFGGLCYLNFNDVGFGNAVRLVYSQL